MSNPDEHELSQEPDKTESRPGVLDLDAREVYRPDQIDALVERYLTGANREELDVILDACVEVYKTELGGEEQVDFKGKAKAFLRTYRFLSTVLPYTFAA